MTAFIARKQEQSMCESKLVLPGAQPSQVPGCSLRILLVDDNVDAVESLGVLLGMYGHHVRTCTHPLEALDTAPEFAPDVCVLDIGMPAMSGHELARRLQTAGLTGTKYIALTGYGSDEVRKASRDAGFVLHLTKPVDPEVLVKRLASIGAARTEA